MLENLFNLVKEKATTPVINNPAIPDEHNEAVIAEATHSVASSLQNELAGGGLQNILSMFAKGSTDHNSLMNYPLVGSIISNFTGKLSGNFGVEHDHANAVANNLIPGVVSDLISKTNDPNNSSFDINGLIHSLTEGNPSHSSQTQSGFDVQNIINSFTDGRIGADNDRQVDINDIVSKVTDAAQQQQSKSGSGLMDMIKGFLK